MQVKVWICPTLGCGNYYASSTEARRGVDLRAEIVHGRPEDRDDAGKRLVKGKRSFCPDCRVRGLGGVHRQPMLVDVVLPAAVTNAA